jgi:hypothetical protein
MIADGNIADAVTENEKKSAGSEGRDVEALSPEVVAHHPP